VAGILCRVLLAASLIGNFWSAGYAAPEAGKAVAVVQSATSTGSNGRRTLKAGMSVSIGERIRTNSGGQVQLVFTDDTKMVVGPNSSLVIESYLFRSKSTVNKFAVKALGGSFRFITGNSPKKAYSIKTPAATIGVRGTSFDFTVGRGGSADVVVFSGEAEVCSNGGCVQLNEACSIASAPLKADVRLVRTQEHRKRKIRERFPYIVSQKPLRRDFHVATGRCGDLQKVKLQAEPRITGSIPQAAPPAPEPPGEPGNPGNGQTNGNAGASPGGNDMGDREKGRSDNNKGKGNNSSKNKG
jgi:hypothetical protein